MATGEEKSIHESDYTMFMNLKVQAVVAVTDTTKFVYFDPVPL